MRDERRNDLVADSSGFYFGIRYDACDVHRYILFLLFIRLDIVRAHAFLEVRTSGPMTYIMLLLFLKV